MVRVNARKESESGVMPTREKMAGMGKFNEGVDGQSCRCDNGGENRDDGVSQFRGLLPLCVVKLEERGFDPRRVGSDAWEVRCPAHRSADRAC